MSNKVDNEYIFRAIHIGDMAEFTDILERHPTLNINIQNDEGESLLIHCVKRSGTKWTPVIGGEFRAICKILIKRNIDVNLRDASGKTAANYAAELQQLEILRLLIQHGAQLDSAVLDRVIDKEDWILAICASFAKESGQGNEHVNGDQMYGSTMMKKGETVKLKLFHRLLSSNYLSSIRWLCELFPEIIEKRNEDSLTALHIVVTENNIDALKILLEFKTDLETVDNNGHTALHFAVDYGHTDCVLTLLNSGSLVNCQDVSGATPLHYAINAGSQDDDVIIKQLLKFGASTSLADRNGRLPLHWAANYGNPTVCVSMVENGSPVNSRCNDGHTALHIAASHGHEECIRVLITKCGADMNIEDKFGYTPLFNAIITRHVQCAKLLLQHKALPNHKDTKGNSAAHLAASKGLIEVLQELVHHQGSHEHRNNAGDLPLHEAALFQRLDIVKHIITSRCEVDVRNNQGLTPLHLCASVGSIAVCECLLKGGADINCINTQCKNGLYKFLTPLDLARMNKHAECVNYLQINGGRSGERMTTAASRKIQRWWKARRPPKIALGSNREYAEECSEEMMEATQDTLERSTEEYVTQTENTGGRKEDEEPSRHKQGDDLNDQINGQECDCRNRGNPHRQIEANLDQNSSLKNSAENADNALKRAEETSTLDVEGDELETTFPEKNEIEVHTPAKTMEPSVDLPENQQDCGVVPKQADQKENVDGIRTKTASKLETRQAIKQRLKESLEKEKLRKEKLSEEIERLKNDLEDRCLRLEKRLGAIQQNLKKL